MQYHKVIGIDLGTTYSAVSIWDGKEVRLLESAIGLNTVPSVVGLDNDRAVIVGAPAQNNLISDPENTVIEVKREMGTYEVEPTGAGDPGTPRRIPFRGREYLPQEISAFILMELKRQAEHIVGEPIHDAVITVPAYFKDPQRGATEDAARMARLNVHRLLNEPTAAAVCFGADKLDEDDDETHTYVVYDLGGGTFDVSVVQVTRGTVEVVGTGGDPRLGGGDFDDRITAYVLQRIQQEHGVDLTGDPAIWQRVKREAEMRKRELSSANTAALNLPFLTATLSVNVPLTRATFEELIDDLLQRSLTCLDEAIESAARKNDVQRDDIEQVLLVGGSTKIFCIRNLLAEHLGLDPADIRADIKPDEVVARGAGIVAREYQPSESYGGQEIPLDMSEGTPKVSKDATVLLDVTSHTLGIMTGVQDMTPIMAKDSRIPSAETKDNFINGGSGSKEINVQIFQGESPIAFENDRIGTLPIILPEAREKGYYRFAVTFALDLHGLLKVAVKCLNDDQIWQTEVQCNVRATKEQIEESSQHLAEVLAGSNQAGPAPAAVKPASVKPADLPKPPGALPKPPGSLPKPPGQAAAEALQPPPAETPDEFKSTARRAFKLIPSLSGADRDRLTAHYRAFVAAVQAGSPDVEDLGDELYDLFRELKG